MKGKILTGSLIVMAIACFGLAGISTASAETYPLNVPICSTVTYGAFGNCINGIRARAVIATTPSNCALSAFDKANRGQVCGQVLGLKIYRTGTLLRSPDGKIYVIMPGQKIKPVLTLSALQVYRGREIYNVSDELIAQYRKTYGQVLGTKVYADGTLLRGPDWKVFVISGGKKQYVAGLDELSAYAGRKIFNVSASVLAGL